MATQEQGTTFNPNEHLQRIQGKEYLPVRWRLVWFRQATGPRAGYLTIELEHDWQAGFSKFFAIAWDGSDETWRTIKAHGLEIQVCGRVATGEGSETRADFNDHLEKSETKALGRALAGLGFGTQFAPEFDEKHRIVDTPTERSSRPTSYNPARTGGNGASAITSSGPVAVQQETDLDGTANEQASREEPPANEQQMISIRKLCAALGREEPDPRALTFAGASALIRQLSREYNTARRAS